MLDKLKAFWATLKSQLVDIWNRSKIFLIALGIAVVYLEWEKIKEAFLLYTANKEMKSDKKEDQTLAATETSASQQADALVKQAQALPSQEQPVTEDWYTKKDSK